MLKLSSSARVLFWPEISGWPKSNQPRRDLPMTLTAVTVTASSRNWLFASGTASFEIICWPFFALGSGEKNLPRHHHQQDCRHAEPLARPRPLPRFQLLPDALLNIETIHIRQLCMVYNTVLGLIIPLHFYETFSTPLLMKAFALLFWLYSVMDKR